MLDMHDTDRRILLKFPAEAEYIDLARLTLYGVANKMGFSYEDIEDMKVAVAEACNNSVIHAYQEMESGMIDVEFSMENSALTIKVTDHGVSFHYEQSASEFSPLASKDLHTMNTGGLGIYLMQALMDKVEVITENGTHVIMTKYLA
jgi:serine/threonine-protein kinase RsbW